MTGASTMRATNQVARDTAIDHAVERFALVRAATIRMVSGLTDEQATFSPRSDAWSVSQILDHLLASEALYRTQMKRLLEMAKEGKRSNLDISLAEIDLALPFVPKTLMPVLSLPLTVFNLFVPGAVREAFFRFPVMKAKAPTIAQPSAARPMATIREELSSSQSTTEELFSGVLPPNAGRVTVSHPVVGRNTIPKMLGLMAAHEERHGGQMKSVMRHPSFPA